ncbi:MAG: hypothetical protein HC802_06135 [Caldilineaceae bacterium]|nr:hypothetical protein [Caldilineaceae bacterium]
MQRSAASGGSAETEQVGAVPETIKAELESLRRESAQRATISSAESAPESTSEERAAPAQVRIRMNPRSSSPLPLVQLTRIGPNALQRNPYPEGQSEGDTRPVRQSPSQALAGTSSVSPSQRDVDGDEDDEDEGGEDFGRSDAEINELAIQILPIVKRMLAVERERSPMRRDSFR